ncbi:MAG: ferredoxin [Mycobacterium sp.]
MRSEVPEFFTLDEEGYSSIDSNKEVPSGQEVRVRMGVEACPVQAVSISDE